MFDPSTAIRLLLESVTLIHAASRDYEDRLRHDLETKLGRMLQDAAHHGQRGYIEARFRINHRIREPHHAPRNFSNSRPREREHEQIRRSSFGQRHRSPPEGFDGSLRRPTDLPRHFWE